MEIFLPRQFSRHTMYGLISQIIDNKSPVNSDFVFNFTHLEFIDPSGVTVLSNLIEWLRKRNAKIFLTLPDRKKLLNGNRNPIKFLDDSLFFESYLGKKYLTNSSPRKTTLPLRLISYENSFGWITQVFVPWLASTLNVDIKSLVSIRVCMEELFNNIKDHAQENIGCIFVQHYPNLHVITISISDFGVGIPYCVKSTTTGIMTDSDAIEKSIEKGFTTRSTPRNTGAGLDVLIYNVVLNNGGSVYIHSNYGILICSKSDSGLCTEKQESDVFYPGTLFEIRLQTDNLEYGMGDEEDFSW